MSLTPSLDPAFLSDLDGVPVDEVSPHVETVAREGSPAALKTLTGVFLDRALHVLRSGSRRDLLEEALAVSRGISGEAGRLLRQRDPATYGAWTALDNLLGEAGRRSDQDAVPSILKGTQGLGLRVLEILAKEDKPVRRARIRETLNSLPDRTERPEVTESHLSHLLYNLEEADLVVRFRQGKEVHVQLGSAGKDLVKTTVCPGWVDNLLGAMERAIRGEQLDRTKLADEIFKAGAPSQLVAEKLGTALAQVAAKLSDLGQTPRQPRSASDYDHPRGSRPDGLSNLDISPRAGYDWGHAHRSHGLEVQG